MEKRKAEQLRVIAREEKKTKILKMKAQMIKKLKI